MSLYVIITFVTEAVMIYPSHAVRFRSGVPEGANMKCSPKTKESLVVAFPLSTDLPVDWVSPQYARLPACPTARVCTRIK